MTDRTGSAPARVVAAFDFDKTLSERDNVVPFLRTACGTPALVRTLTVLAPRLVEAGLLDSHRDRLKAALVRRLLAGRPVAELREIAERFADDVVAHHLARGMLERAQGHREQGHELVIVSASLAIYLEPIGARLGFDAVLATELEVDGDGLLTGELAGANVRRAEKVRRLDEWLGDDPATVWAYGDSTGDRELLARADHPVRL